MRDLTILIVFGVSALFAMPGLAAGFGGGGGGEKPSANVYVMTSCQPGELEYDPAADSGRSKFRVCRDGRFVDPEQKPARPWRAARCESGRYYWDPSADDQSRAWSYCHEGRMQPPGVPAPE